MALGKKKKKKKDETPAHASPTKSKPTVAVTQTEEVRAASVQRNDGYTKDQAVKKNRTRTQIYKQIRWRTVYTHHNGTKIYTIARIHVQTRGREEEQPKTKHHWQTACFFSPPSSRGTRHYNPSKPPQKITWDTPFPRNSEPSSWPGLTCVPALMPSGL